MSRGPGRLVLLCGPSCAGKSPLIRALARLYPAEHDMLAPLVLHNSRAPRPGERDGVDYHFRPRAVIEKLRDNARYIVMDVRGDLQAVDMTELAETLRSSHVLFEGNPFVGAMLLEAPALAGVPRLAVFLAPLGRGEILDLKAPGRGVDLPALVADVMRRKLLRRTQRQKGILSAPDLADIERRAGSAYRELRLAARFDSVIPNHDGEDSENWEAFYHPLGDARRALEAFRALLRGDAAPGVSERWEEALLPPRAEAGPTHTLAARGADGS